MACMAATIMKQIWVIFDQISYSGTLLDALFVGEEVFFSSTTTSVEFTLQSKS